MKDEHFGESFSTAVYACHERYDRVLVYYIVYLVWCC